jgi:hypothetical protein
VQAHIFKNHSQPETKKPDPLIGIGRKPKSHTFSAMRSFPTKPRNRGRQKTGGSGVSTQTLSPKIQDFARTALGFLPLGRPGRSIPKVYAYGGAVRNPV